jgi:peptide chain release factor 1
MIEKLESIEQTYDQLTREMSDPEVISETARYTRVAKQHRELEPVVARYRALRKLEADLEGAREILQTSADAEMREMAEAELSELETKRDAIESELKLLLVPRDPNDEKNVILEVRAGTGGEEACLFAAEILRMYSRYAERQRSISGSIRRICGSIPSARRDPAASRLTRPTRLSV